MLPDGFIELVEKVMKEDPLGQCSSKSMNIESLWKDFTWGIFLDNNRNNAEVTYIRDVLWDEELLNRSWILEHTLQEWEDKTKNSISNCVKNKDGRKKGALNGLLSDLSSPAQSLKESAVFFKYRNVSPQLIMNLTAKENSIDCFLKQMTYQPTSSYVSPRMINPDKIHNIAITKALLWLQNYGMTKDYCPPSRQIKDFVDFDIKHLAANFHEKPSWVQKTSIPITNDWSYISYMRNFNNNEVKPKISNSTVRDVGLAVWYWKSTQGLPAIKGTRFKKLLTPKRF